ncbi:MAG TPA: hypothetical protein VD997_00175 [Phycisphaerales bacterium]|nr:hypothetical protein [Phycisphaerales bacterium]
MHRKAVAGAVLMALSLAGAASAQTMIDIDQPGMTLANVLGHSFRVGDKIFTFTQNSFLSDQFNANQIFISSFQNADPMTGVGFRLTGAFNDLTPGDLDPSGFMLTYSVTVAPEFAAQGYRLTHGQLRFNGAATGAGSFARVDETMRTAADMLIGTGNVQATEGGPNVYGHDFVSSEPVTHINVVKNVRFFAAGEGGTASASFVDQGFGQTVIIPLPGTAGLGLAGLGLVALRRRRR